MNRPYRKLGRPQLQQIANENWDSPHTLKNIADELSHRDSSVERKDVRELYESVLQRRRELESMAETRPDDGKLRLRLQEIKQLRNRAKNTGVFEWFKWPTTDAPIGDGSLDASGWNKDGLFSHVGYHVGNDGEHVDVRHYILDCVFHNELQHDNSDEYMREYMREFAAPQSPQRLRKMADFLASMARNCKRKEHADYSQAIADYESDLEYLYNKYYVGAFQFDQHPSNAGRFGWPDT